MHHGFRSVRVSRSAGRSSRHHRFQPFLRSLDSRRPRPTRGAAGNSPAKRYLRFEDLEPRLNLAPVAPVLNSLPGADHTIYLDFTGHDTAGESWNTQFNSGNLIASPAYDEDGDDQNFTSAEEATITEIFNRVAEDFAPFKVNVTTVEPPIEDLEYAGPLGLDNRWGVRVVITTDTVFNCNCSGQALIDSFNSSSDTPAFVFYTYAFGSPTPAIGIAEAISHEVGHTLGLTDDGTSSVATYGGHGAGATSWASIMGTSYTSNVTQWDNGEYFDSNNSFQGVPFSLTANGGKGPDDLAVITGYNGFGYRDDEEGTMSTTGVVLSLWGPDVYDSGIIETREDVDYFYFQAGDGMVSLNIVPAAIGANLDIKASLYDTNGNTPFNLIAVADDPTSLSATINAYVTEYLYLLVIEGTGVGDPTVNPPVGYTDYGSIGRYTIEGTINPTGGNSSGYGIHDFDSHKPEGNSGYTAFSFRAERGHPIDRPERFSWSVSSIGMNAASPEDFYGGEFPSGTGVFEHGDFYSTITILVAGDNVIELNEIFVVTIDNITASYPNTPISTGGTIMDDDTLVFFINATGLSKMEGTGPSPTTFTVYINRSGGLGTTASVEYSVAGIGVNPANDADFVTGLLSNQVAQFAINQATYPIHLEVVADNVQECSESFRVSLSNPVGGTIGAASAVDGLIRDDDASKGRVYPKCLLRLKSAGSKSISDDIIDDGDFYDGGPAKVVAGAGMVDGRDYGDEFMPVNSGRFDLFYELSPWANQLLKHRDRGAVAALTSIFSRRHATMIDEPESLEAERLTDRKLFSDSVDGARLDELTDEALADWSAT